MKNALVALTALAMLAGCNGTKTVEVTSSGPKKATTEDAQPATQNGDSDILAKDESTPDTPVASGNPLGAAKKDETKPIEVVVTEPGKFATKDFVGMYDGKLDLPPAFFEQMKTMVPPDQQATVEAQFRSIRVSLELKAGDRYALITSGGGASQTENGKWVYDKAKNVVTLNAPEITAERRAQLKQSGRTDAQIDEMLKESQSATVSPDGRTLTLTKGEMGMDFKLTFTKR